MLATGFDLWDANFPAIEESAATAETWESGGGKNRFQAYQGVSMPHFPNYLSLASPFAFLRPVLLQHDGISDAATWTACWAR